MSESFRTLQARLGALALHATRDSRITSQPARDAFMARFAREVVDHAAERGEVLTEAEIARRAEYRKRAYFTRLALASAKARGTRKGGRR